MDADRGAQPDVRRIRAAIVLPAGRCPTTQPGLQPCQLIFVRRIAKPTQTNLLCRQVTRTDWQRPMTVMLLAGHPSVAAPADDWSQ
jgi:hypothetical protein